MCLTYLWRHYTFVSRKPIPITSMKHSTILLMTAALFAAAVSCEEEKTGQGSLSLGQTTLNFEASGAAAQTLTVTADNITWTAAPENSADTWLSVDFNTESITVSVEDNTEAVDRTARIAVVPENEGIPTEYITVNQAAGESQSTQMTSGMLRYYGENFSFPTNGTAEYRMFLFDGDVDYEEVHLGDKTYYEQRNANGTGLNITSFCSMAEDYYHPEMVPGTYTYSDVISEMTFTAGTTYEVPNKDGGFIIKPDRSYVADFENGVITDYILVTGGEWTLSIKGNRYIADFNLELEDGTTAHFTYDGELHVGNLATPPFASQLQEDISLGADDMQSATVVTTSEYSPNPDVRSWVVELVENGITVNGTQISGTGCYSRINLYAPSAEGTDRLPDGEYTIMQGSIFGEWSASAGSSDPFLGQTGCYVLSYTDNTPAFGPMSSGTITIEYPDDDTYRIIIDAMDDNGHNIDITYEGPITIPQV